MEAPDSIYCKDEATFCTLLRNLDSLINDGPAHGGGPLLLDFHGKHLGSTDGDLSLLVLGLPSKTYIVDAIVLDGEIPRLRTYLQDRRVRKFVWDGRSGYAELWHRYSIRLENVLDLQLVYLHEKYDASQRKCLLLHGKTVALREKQLLSPTAVESDLNRTCRDNCSNAGRRGLQSQSCTERPLSIDNMESALTQMNYIRQLTTNLIPQVKTSANILRESKRYIELWHHRRPARSNRYKTHNYLPQGIIERTEAERNLKLLGTRKCRGCERDLYQESFQVDFRRFARNPEKQFCYTCAKVNLRQVRRARFLDIMELAKSRTSSPALMSDAKA